MASQYNFAFGGWEKDLTEPQSERKWNDVFVWSDKLENPGISIDAGLVFLPEKTQVDPETGSKYASEVKIIEGKEQRVMIEDSELVNGFMDWVRELDEQSDVIKKAYKWFRERGGDSERREFTNSCHQELQRLGFSQNSAATLFSEIIDILLFWSKDTPIEGFQDIINKSSAKYKKAEKTIAAKEYWEDYFSKNPDLKPKHVVYYSGNPTSAIYRFQQETKIGLADTSETEGKLLGFDDHHVTDLDNDPRSNVGHQELVDSGNKIISEHYQYKT